jgi:hypothetical protein
MTTNEGEQREAPRPTPTPAPISAKAAALEWHAPPRRYCGDAALDPIARLEWLDDLMFAAIDGDPVALDNAAEAWQKTLDELGLSALEESRLQYLRHAQAVWHALRQEPDHPPHKVFAAIEIISLLASRGR